jgi:hypothetical protein
MGEELRSATVGIPVSAYDEMMDETELIRDLLQGTDHMRDCGTTYLPQEDEETTTAYNNRKKRTVLLGAFERTLQKLTGEVFSKDMVLQEDTPQEIKDWVEDVDDEGNDLGRFSWLVFEDALAVGSSFILVDYPAIQVIRRDGKPYYVDSWDGVEKPLTKEVELKMGWKPYLVHVKAENLIGWRFEKLNGRMTLTQIRINELTEEPDGEYGSKNVERVRVIYRDRWELWRKVEKEQVVKSNTAGTTTTAVAEGLAAEYFLEEQGTRSFGEIMLAPVFLGKKTGRMTCKPPLKGLAELNLVHWQSSSDQRNILHYARMATYFGRLLQVSGKDKKVKFGANQLIHGTDPNSDLKVVEHSGKAIDSGRQDLKDLEDSMAMFGLTQMMPRTGNATATERAIDTSESNSSLKTYAMVFEDALNQAISWVGLFFGKPEGQSGGVSVNTDFLLNLSEKDVEVILKAVDQGILSKSVAFNELKKRGIVGDEVEFEDMLAEIQKEKEDQSKRDQARFDFLRQQQEQSATAEEEE